MRIDPRKILPEAIRPRQVGLAAALAAGLGIGAIVAAGGAAEAQQGVGSMTGMTARLSDLEAEVRRLTAMLEEVQNRQRLIAEEAARRFSDIEFRLTELEGGDVGGLQPVPPLGGIGSGLGGGAAIGMAQGTDVGTVAPRDTQLAAVSVAEQGDLDRAAADVQQGRYDQAEDRLRRFLRDYPASPLTGDAWYWLGESQLVRGATGEAARSYLSGYNADRRGARAPHNLYGLGVSLGRLGQINEACLTLREVGAQFPSAPDGLVAKAASEADALACG
jgi:tol-pal system protein YbgF